MKLSFFIFIVIIIFSIKNGNANIGQEFGFGSRTSALAGAGVAWGAGSYSAYHNPAQLGLGTNKKLQVDFGLLYMRPSFKPITNILTQNKYVSDSDVTGDVDNSTYRDTFGAELGLSYNFTPGSSNLTLGLTTFLPAEQIAYMDTGEAYVPEYILYRARTQRPQIDLGIGADLGNHLYAGFGLHFGFTLTSNATVFINTQKNTISNLRFSSSLKPKAAPYFGILWTPTDTEQKNFSLGGVFRLPVTSDSTMTLNSAARVFGNFAAVDFNFTANSALYYDPMAIELGSSWQHSEWGRLYTQLEYQFWSRYQAPALLIQQPETTNCSGSGCTGSGTLTISPGALPNVTYVNIVVPRLGWELTPIGSNLAYRLGYAYRPSILSEIPNGNGNFLDPPKHLLNAGVGFSFDHFLDYNVPCRLDFNLAYQYLVSQTVTKTPGNEVGDGSDSKIGSPGYNVGGSVYGGGMTLSLAL